MSRSDIIFLQEVISEVRSFILVTDAEDQTSFVGVPFANTMLLYSKHFSLDPGSQKERDGVERGKKFMIGLVSRVSPPSKFGRCALSVDIVPPSISNTVYHLINVHLDSLRDMFPHRTEQMDIIAKFLQDTVVDLSLETSMPSAPRIITPSTRADW